jgi:hypothetical protein
MIQLLFPSPVANSRTDQSVRQGHNCFAEPHPPDLWKTLSDRRRSRRVAIYTWRKDTIGIFGELPLRIEEHDGT